MDTSHTRALFCRLFILLIATISLVAGLAATAIAQLPGFFAFYPWTGAQGTHYESLMRNTDKITYISPMWYMSNDGRGTVTGTIGDPEMLKLAQAAGIKVLPNLYNWSEAGWDQQKVHMLLSTPAYREKLIEGVHSIVTANAFDGITLDLENLSTADRANYTALVRDLARKLHSAGKMLALAVPAKTSDSPYNTWSYPFDYPALASYADLIFIMAYDEHWTAADPGPVASFEFIDQVSAYARTVIPPSKLIMGLPFYGYDFKSSPPVSHEFLSYSQITARANQLGVKASYSSSYRVPYVLYTQSGQNHEMWFENAQSFQEKYGLLAGRGIATGAFVLGYEDPAVWRLVPNKTPPPGTETPSVHIVYPRNGANVTNPIAIEARTSGGISASAVKMYVDNVLIAIFGSGPYYLSWDALGLSEGYHEISVEATGSFPGVYRDKVGVNYRKQAAPAESSLFRPQEAPAPEQPSALPDAGSQAKAVASESSAQAPSNESVPDTTEDQTSQGQAFVPSTRTAIDPPPLSTRRISVSERRPEAEQRTPQTSFFPLTVLFLLMVLRLKILG